MDWLSENLWAVWLSAGLALGIAELFSMELILIMLATGAFAGMLLALLGAPFAIQALCAAGVSVAMLAFLRKPMTRRLHAGPDLATGPTRLVGERAVVTAEITNLMTGQIRLAGETWTASTDANWVLKPGEPVEVVQIDGATACVKPVIAGELRDPRND